MTAPSPGARSFTLNCLMRISRCGLIGIVRESVRPYAAAGAKANGKLVERSHRERAARGTARRLRAARRQEPCADGHGRRSCACGIRHADCCDEPCWYYKHQPNDEDQHLFHPPPSPPPAMACPECERLRRDLSAMALEVARLNKAHATVLLKYQLLRDGEETP